jgi:hypothetical protein
LSSGERPRGLVVLPGLPEARPASFTRRRGVLIATLLLGVVAVVVIALLWSSAPRAPNPRSLPPADVRGGF